MLITMVQFPASDLLPSPRYTCTKLLLPDCCCLKGVATGAMISDLNICCFISQGRIHQIEYAMEAVKQVRSRTSILILYICMSGTAPQVPRLWHI